MRAILERSEQSHASVSIDKEHVMKTKAELPATRRSADAKGGAGRPARRTTPEQRHRMIAESAYLRAAGRDFHEGDPVEDWLVAEAEVDAMLVAEIDPGGKNSAGPEKGRKAPPNRSAKAGRAMPA